MEFPVESQLEQLERALLALDRVAVSRMLSDICAASSPLERVERLIVPVLEDYHMLGMRIVYSALRASGFTLTNYGRVDMDQLVARVRSDGIRILLLSALMLPAALRVKVLRDRLQAEGCLPRIVVGGAPFRFDDALPPRTRLPGSNRRAWASARVFRRCCI